MRPEAPVAAHHRVPGKGFSLIRVVAFCAMALSLGACRSLGTGYRFLGSEESHAYMAADRFLAEEAVRHGSAGLDRPLVPVKVIAPDYPKWIVREHQGDVLVAVVIESDGTVGSATARPGDNPVLAQLLIDAVKQWRFEPITKAGQPTRLRLRVPFSFRRS